MKKGSSLDLQREGEFITQISKLATETLLRISDRVGFLQLQSYPMDNTHHAFILIRKPYQHKEDELLEVHGRYDCNTRREAIISCLIKARREMLNIGAGDIDLSW
jgi:hypothetical protein